MVMVCAFSEWPEVHELGAHATMLRTIKAMRRSFSYLGISRKLVTDNGPQFQEHKIREFMKTNGIRHQCNPPDHPTSNGQAEKIVQEPKRSLKSKPSNRSTKHQISVFLLHYRTTPNTTTGQTPSQLLMKRGLGTKLSLLRPDLESSFRDQQKINMRKPQLKLKAWIQETTFRSETPGK